MDGVLGVCCDELHYLIDVDKASIELLVAGCFQADHNLVRGNNFRELDALLGCFLGFILICAYFGYEEFLHTGFEYI